MNLPEAIEILERDRKEHHSFPTDIIGKAEQLDSEAMKRELEHRQDVETTSPWLLPGETEE